MTTPSDLDSKLTLEVLTELYVNQKQTISDIARKLETSNANVRNRLKKHGLYDTSPERLKPQKMTLVNPEEVERLYLGGMSVTDVAKATRNSFGACDKHLANIKRGANYWKKEVPPKESLISDWESGLTLSDIATNHGTTVNTVKTWFDSHGIERNRTHSESLILAMKKKITPFEDFVARASEKHKGKYDYSKAEIDYVKQRDAKIKLEIICPEHGSFWQTAHHHLSLGNGCQKCGHIISGQETAITEWLNSQGIDYKTSVRGLLNDNQEIDVLVGQIGIEMNGDYWHSTKVKGDFRYHLKKTEAAELVGLQLLHVAEHEWNDPVKREIWKSVILAKLGKLPIKIHARKCSVKQLKVWSSSEFLEENHLQGNANVGNIRYGLFDRQLGLVALMTFSNADRFRHGQEWELVRFATKLNTNVVGGFSRLLAAFERDHSPKTLLSYANRRWSNGNVYQKNGFDFVGQSDPSFVGFKGKTVYSRHYFMKQNCHSLKGYVYDPSKTQAQNMTDNGYHRIYDCGNLIFVKRYNKD